jgi:hypothetical protein
MFNAKSKISDRYLKRKGHHQGSKSVPNVTTLRMMLSAHSTNRTGATLTLTNIFQQAGWIVPVQMVLMLEIVKPNVKNCVDMVSESSIYKLQHHTNPFSQLMHSFLGNSFEKARTDYI